MLSDDIINKRRQQLNSSNFPSEIWFNYLLSHHGLDAQFERNLCLDRTFFGDFVCLKYKIVIEIDGKSHQGKEMYDSQRDSRLQNLGFIVFRIKWGDRKKAFEVIDNLKNLFNRFPKIKRKIKNKVKKKKTKPQRHRSEASSKILADHDRRRKEFKEILKRKRLNLNG